MLRIQLHEDEGTVTTVEGRCMKINRGDRPTGRARHDLNPPGASPRRLGQGPVVGDSGAEENVDTGMPGLQAGGAAAPRDDLAGPRRDSAASLGPCPARAPGTPRLFEGGRFHHPDGLARFVPVTHRPPAEVVDDEYPIWLTTGRVISQYLSGLGRADDPLHVDQVPNRCAGSTEPPAFGVADDRAWSA
ncbi:MAG: hypothetical protein U5R31_08935 [Acidimicrobiia bacterium]|nr:hypothetical protein [Acidimicrobiia bacterium]